MKAYLLEDDNYLYVEAWDKEKLVWIDYTRTNYISYEQLFKGIVRLIIHMTACDDPEIKVEYGDYYNIDMISNHIIEYDTDTEEFKIHPNINFKKLGKSIVIIDTLVELGFLQEVEHNQVWHKNFVNNLVEFLS